MYIAIETQITHDRVVLGLFTMSLGKRIYPILLDF